MRHTSKLLSNVKNSIRGIKIALLEHSFFIEFALALLVVIYLYFFCQSNFFKYLISLSYTLLLAIELINTAIERVCNRVTRDFDQEIMDIKDLSSAAVFLLVTLNVFLLVISFMNDSITL